MECNKVTYSIVTCTCKTGMWKRKLEAVKLLWKR